MLMKSIGGRQQKKIQQQQRLLLTIHRKHAKATKDEPGMLHRNDDKHRKVQKKSGVRVKTSCIWNGFRVPKAEWPIHLQWPQKTKEKAIFRF